MFNINDFLMKTIKGMIGNYPDFQVREYALGWWSKGKLTEEDLASIDATIEAQYVEPPVVEEITEEVVEETEPSVNEEVIDDPLEETPADDETE